MDVGFFQVQIEDFVWARRVQKAKCPLELDPVLKGKKTEERLQKIIKRLRSAPNPTHPTMFRLEY